VPGFLLGLDTEPMEAKVVDALPDGPEWQFEPKWDGFRCLAYKAAGEVDLRAKSGKPLGRYFPEMIEALVRAKADNFVLDGELMVPRGDSLSFGALQDRVHPAESRVRKLAAETPALLVLFDCLAVGHTGSLLGAVLTERRAALERVMAGIVRRTGSACRLSHATDSRPGDGWNGRVALWMA
jgi:ATP-dependent DNA ligase